MLNLCKQMHLPFLDRIIHIINLPFWLFLDSTEHAPVIALQVVHVQY